jgi:uracil-DNA glycosylase
MQNNVNWDIIRPLLGEWSNYLQPVFESKEMNDLFGEFKEVKKQEIITPNSQDTFRFLYHCPPNLLKLIVIGMDSYPGKYKNGTLQADGISFSCSNSPDKKLQPSLEYMYNAIEKELEIPLNRNPDLRPIANQGVILGNRALNCKLNKTGSFIGKWDFFWEYFIKEVITTHFQGVPFLLLGKEAQRLEKYIMPLTNPIFKLSHPSAAARIQSDWETKGYFKTINKIITLNGQEPINWKI